MTAHVLAVDGVAGLGRDTATEETKKTVILGAETQEGRTTADTIMTSAGTITDTRLNTLAKKRSNFIKPPIIPHTIH